jgi:hypothetical protein
MALIRVSVYQFDLTPVDKPEAIPVNVRLINTNCIVQACETKVGDYHYQHGCRAVLVCEMLDSVVTLFVAETLDQIQQG